MKSEGVENCPPEGPAPLDKSEYISILVTKARLFCSMYSSLFCAIPSTFFNA